LQLVTRRIAASVLVPAPQATVFAYLADLGHHWTLSDRFIEVVELDASGGLLRLNAPLRITRLATTRVRDVRPPRVLSGVATVGRRNAARIDWTLEGMGAVTAVRLEVTVLRVDARHALLLSLGGRRWLRGRFSTVLTQLAARFAE
jgi:hypothetical protein